ncbi:Uncharacterised protein [Zhongshania aliphaticivorans]|uniref:DUF2489 domain-containing protein n=1 Tax=Zhongshania aliphaticivorans TaxID=1470434 RepID=A0A5S9P5U1_9GAMM|nr:DUF2489 domain-containing protein [Zhongshania aliphaticivorans]CAA0091384.1 Uncharacterised protein [Zhongshania aliphaticivorans]CAA0098771.1 Uncharacterised protein [Zhongshania aliphaticivorans]
MSAYLIWLVPAALIVIVLAIIAARLLWQLHQQNQAQRSALQQAEQESVAEQLDAQSGIEVLARCYLSGQVETSEFVLRTAVLAETAMLDSSYDKNTQVFTEMAAALSHIPTHQGWKALSAEQRAEYGAEMALLEGKYSERLRAAANELIN